MHNLRFLPCLLAWLLSLSAVAEPQAESPATPPAKSPAKLPATPPAKSPAKLPAKSPATPQATLQGQALQFVAPRLAQVEPLYAFFDSLERALGSAELTQRVQRAGLHGLLLPATQATWVQRGLAPDKPLVVHMQPHALACMGVADNKVLAATVEALPGEEKTTQKGALHYRVVPAGPEHRFILFWNAQTLCTRPHRTPQAVAALPKELEKTLVDSSALFQTAAKQSAPLLSLGREFQLYMEPASARQLKLRLQAASTPWRLKATPGGKTVLHAVSAEAGALLKLHGTPASEVLRPMDFMAALSPKGDALLAQKRTWFARLESLLAEEFLAQWDFPDGRNTERLLLVAKLKADSEAAFDVWLSQMPKEEGATEAAVLPTQRGPLVFGRKGSWAFAATRPEQALAQVEQLEKAKPEAAPPLVGWAFPQTLEAVLQGESFFSLAMGLNPRQLRLLRFNAPLRNLIYSLQRLHMEAHPKGNNAAEVVVDIALVP